MMFAHAVYFNVFYDDHFTDVFTELGRIKNCLRIHLVAMCKVLHCPRQALRRFQ